ncbi:hypothetical protein ABPG74_018222 [Tetrahymena malaccensis]
MKYELNASLYNHIRLKHNKDVKAYKCETKLGRPKGKQNKTIKKDKPKAPPKILNCKCGKVLKSDGALSNHIRLKHKNLPEFQPIKKQQGRKRKVLPNQENEVQQQGLDSQETYLPTIEQNEVINTTIEGPTQNIYQNVNTTKSLNKIYQTYEDQESEEVQDLTYFDPNCKVGDCYQQENDDQVNLIQDDYHEQFYSNQFDFRDIEYGMYQQEDQF